MDAIIHRITESNLSDFKGLAIEGEIPVSEDILNYLVRLFIEDVNETAGNEQENTDENTSNLSSGTSFDIQKVIRALDEKNLEIKLRDEQLVLKVTARKY